MGKKVILAGVASVLLVAAVVGTVLAVVLTNHKDPDDDNSMATSIKSVDALCSRTDHPDVCMKTLGSVSSDNTTDVIRTAVKATLDEIKTVFNHSEDVSKTVSDPMNQIAIQDCKTLLAHAIEELKASFHLAGNISTHAADIRIWLSAVVTYQETCLDGLTLPELKGQMEDKMQTSNALTSNALTVVTILAAIVASIPDAIKNGVAGLDVSQKRLLTDDGYPVWMTAADRKLMASRNNVGLRPDVVVAQDGSGDCRTINEAVKRVPKNNARRFTIYVKAGVYRETVIVEGDNVFMYGDGARKTRVTGDKHFPVPTMSTSTFSVEGLGFICKNMGFFNTAGPEGHQAVALRVQSDRSAFFNCRMDGFQDTLYTHAHRQFYRNCVVSGTVDFIFGDAAAILQNCLIVVRKPLKGQMNTITAHGRKERDEATGLVIHNCRIVPEQALMAERLTVPTFYGRPWKAYSRTIIMESVVGDVIRPEGWLIWQGANFHQTCTYAEYNNRGPGAGTANRVGWARKSIARNEAMTYTVGPFIDGNTWLAATGGRFTMGLKF